MNYITGTVIRELREKKKLTQKELAEILCVSEKTISKWETGRGLPDIGILPELSGSLGISAAELLTGKLAQNENREANMKKQQFYVCPVCGNVIAATGKGAYSCHGITLPALEPEEPDEDHKIILEIVESEYCVMIKHPMTKTHYISFIAYVTSDCMEYKKLYPEQDATVRFTRKGHGLIYAYCNRHGLFQVRV